jgi:hypothetical protein
MMTFGTMKVGAAGNKNVPILFEGRPLVLQLPYLLTFGAEAKSFDGGPSKIAISLKIPNAADKYASPETTFALDNLIRFEQRVIQEVFKNSKEWTNKKPNLDVAAAMMTPILKYRKNEEGEPDKTTSPTLTVKIPEWKERIDTEVYNSRGKLLFPAAGVTIQETLPKQCIIQSLLVVGGIWFSGNGGFGVTFRLKQCILQDPKGGFVRGVCAMKVEAEDDVTGTEKSKERPPQRAEQSGVEINSDDEFQESYDHEDMEGDGVPVKNRIKVSKA